MIAVALILLVLVAVLTLGIFVSNPDIYDLSIFGAVVKVSRELNADISGIGSVEYIGSPQVTQEVSGVGSIKQRAP